MPEMRLYLGEDRSLQQLQNIYLSLALRVLTSRGFPQEGEPWRIGSRVSEVLRFLGIGPFPDLENGY
jgi:hypothetical protein